MSRGGSEDGCSEITEGESRREKGKLASTGLVRGFPEDVPLFEESRMFSDHRFLCSHLPYEII